MSDSDLLRRIEAKRSGTIEEVLARMSDDAVDKGIRHARRRLSITPTESVAAWLKALLGERDRRER